VTKRKNNPSTVTAGTWTLEEPRGAAFASLLRASLRYADRACLVVPELDEAPAPYLAILARLDRFSMLPPRVARSWPGSPKSVTSRVFNYRFCTGLVECLISSASGWFDWRLPERPEDLSLLRGDTEWIVSVTHERLVYLQTERSVLNELLKEVPDMRIKSGPGFRGT